MSLKVDSFPSSAAFDLINASLSDEKERTSAIKKGGAIFAFSLTNTKGESDTWYIDLKSSGTVGKGLGPDGKKADIVLSLSDDDFSKLIEGKANAQKLFMSGKLKVKGDIMKASKAETILKAAQTKKSKL
ncbi:SCP2 sterol-binding domain-containing protein [Lipomyces chichibuensis]|uniref:SCP2 sterol-binding domain-containing protein n=1 Tax=Lipomyces chichibuensis TaxID=1546026 RepID=UPI0033442692